MKWFLMICLTFLAVGVLRSADQTCQSCHQQVQSNCELTCQQCHISTKANNVTSSTDHPVGIANSSQPEWWAEKCQACHAEVINRFRKSLHYTSMGVIDQTRFLFGKNDQLFQTQPDAWQKLKHVKGVKSPSTAGVVDHLLAGKCLSCHFAADRRGDVAGRRHAAGCASCHVELDQKTGKPLHGHRFQKKIADTVCLSCHSGNRVGADYHGFFERDYYYQYQQPFGSRPWFGAFQHHLVKDVHQQAGLQCVDCHKEHVEQSRMPRFEGEQPSVRCQDCHGGFNEKPSPNAAKGPVFNSASVAHQSFHQKIRCSACHAQWVFQDYGLHLFLDQSSNYEMWQDYLWQGDGEVTHLLLEELSKPEELRNPAFSSNKLSGQKMLGIWYQAWTFRRWEDPILGRDTQGRISVLRPLYQYFVTFVDSLDQVWLDSQKPVRKDGKIGWNWDAYVPHTIGRRGRNCESCHLNAKAVGLGIRQNPSDSVAQQITMPAEPVLPNSRLLNAQEQQQLLKKRALYKYWRTKAFQQNGIKKLMEK